MISNPAGRLAGDLKGTPSGKVEFPFKIRE